jgi:glycine C-acetyltransferase
METIEAKKINIFDKEQRLSVRVDEFRHFRNTVDLTYLRNIASPAGRCVSIKDPFNGKMKEMLMFASNNYLGLANHPYVRKAVKKAIDKYGCGIGGPPLLNGYLGITKQAEERLADFKGKESAMLFSSGFLANLGVVSSLAQHNDIIFFDELSHASFYDGLKLTKAKREIFPHNDIDELKKLMLLHSQSIDGDMFVFTEGVFSMDGNLGKLNEIAELCKMFDAKIVLDDAHGTGVIGPGGKGTAAHLHCEDDIEVLMGTFSKVFATSGGFLAASKDLIDYLRFHARSYIFSAAIPPTVVAAVIAGMDVIEKEPWLQKTLLENVSYGISQLSRFGFYATPEAAIVALKIPEFLDIRKAAFSLHEKGIFINSIEYPAVPEGQERFRISFMAEHTKEDIDYLVSCLDEVWCDQTNYSFPI